LTHHYPSLNLISAPLILKYFRQSPVISCTVKTKNSPSNKGRQYFPAATSTRAGGFPGAVDVKRHYLSGIPGIIVVNNGHSVINVASKAEVESGGLWRFYPLINVFLKDFQKIS
jgi:hypothetical protein